MKEQKLVMAGISRKGRNGFDTITPDQPIKPGTYNKFTFAAAYPEKYAEMVKAGAPMIGDGKPVLITIT